MARKTKWTDTRKKDLLNFFNKEIKKGNKSVNKNAELYAETQDDLTATQVRVAYYKFSNAEKYAENAALRRKSIALDALKKTADKKNAKPTKEKTISYKNARWTQEDNDNLLKAIDLKQGKTLLEVFEEYGKEHNRNPKNVSQHYYVVKNMKPTVSKTKSVQKKNIVKEIMDIPYETMVVIKEIANIFARGAI